MTSPRFDSAWLAPESPDVVWFGGTDHVRFLNDLISQEIGNMTPGSVRRSMLLHPTGKLGFLLWVVRDEERVGLVTDPGRGDDLTAALGRYRIRVDVTIDLEPADRWIVVGDWPGGYDLSWTSTQRHLVIGERPDLEVGPVGRYERLRVEAGEPAWEVDLGEGAIPQASGLVGVSVDFDKGCYLGQELVARIDSRGSEVPRRLMVIDSGGPDVAVGPLRADGHDIGVVTSVAGSLGLAMVGRGTAPGTRVEVGGVAAVVRDLPAKSQK